MSDLRKLTAGSQDARREIYYRTLVDIVERNGLSLDRFSYPMVTIVKKQKTDWNHFLAGSQEDLIVAKIRSDHDLGKPEQQGIEQHTRVYEGLSLVILDETYRPELESIAALATAIFNREVVLKSKGN